MKDDKSEICRIGWKAENYWAGIGADVLKQNLSEKCLSLLIRHFN